MANGIPSRRRQISTTAPASAPVASEIAGRNSCEHAQRTGSRRPSRYPLQHIERGHRPQLFVGDPQAFAAGGQDLHRRRARPGSPRSGRRRRRRTCSQLSNTNSRDPALQRGRPRLLATLLPGCWVMPKHRRHGIGHRSRISHRGQFENPDAVGELIGQRAATSSARRVLPTPPTPVNVTNRCSWSAACTSATSDSRPMKLVTAGRRFPGLASSARNGGKSVRRPGART